tara:strand:- start:3277 stop:3720 length:444 start_codon:yes stop_codon:yes gene_type:complete
MGFQYFFVFVWSVFVAASFMLGYTPVLIPYLFIFSSVLTYVLYSTDKLAAKKGEWRTPESTLHLGALLCGWPGALLAQQRLRHKTKKQSFRRVFWSTVIINITLIGGLHTTLGATYFRYGATVSEAYVYAIFGPGLLSKIILALTTY